MPMNPILCIHPQLLVYDMFCVFCVPHLSSSQIVALPYLHETLSAPIDLICTEHKVVELDVEQVKQQSK